MRYVSAVLAVLFFASSPLVAHAQELNKKQKEPWSALERQVALWFKQDWKNHDKYIHPKEIDWGDFTPTPVTAARMKDYTTVLLKGSDKVVSHCLIPVTVTVVDDVAIINCYLQVLTKKNGKLAQSTYRLHNTWKKEGDRWLLLATCNSIVEEGVPVNK